MEISMQMLKYAPFAQTHASSVLFDVYICVCGLCLWSFKRKSNQIMGCLISA